MPAVIENPRLFRPGRHQSIEQLDPEFGELVADAYVTSLSPVIARNPNANILNIGCGDSLWLEKNLAGNYNCASFISLDVNISALLKAKSLHRENNVILSDAKLIPFRESSFDGILLNGSVGEFGTKEQILAALNKFSDLLKPQGRLVMHTVSDKHQFLYKRYQTGSRWIVEGLLKEQSFRPVYRYRTSEKYDTEMIVAVKR